MGSFNNFERFASQLEFKRMVLVPGNHDYWIDPNAGTDLVYIGDGRKIFITAPITQLQLNDKQRITLCHFPMRSWHASYHGTWHLYGHVHRVMEPWGMAMDVGVDGSGGYLYTEDNVREYMVGRREFLDSLKEKDDENRLHGNEKTTDERRPSSDGSGTKQVSSDDDGVPSR